MKTVLSLSLLCAALAVPAAAQQGSQPNPAGEPSATTQDAGGVPAKKKGHGKHNERHPMIHRAMAQLKNAKSSLEKAEKEFGGHRQKAIEHIDMALNELDQALKYHQEHEGQEKNEGGENK